MPRLSALVLNLAVGVVLSLVFNALRRGPRVDETTAQDYV